MGQRVEVGAARKQPRLVRVGVRVRRVGVRARVRVRVRARVRVGEQSRHHVCPVVLGGTVQRRLA